MSLFSDSLGSRVKIIRRSSFMVPSVAVSANPTIDRQPARSVYLRVFADTPVGGTVQLAGGSAVEAVTFTSGQRTKKQTTQTFSALANLTIQGLTGGTISIEAILQTGEPVLTDKVISTSMACKWYALNARRIRFARQAAGQVAVGDFRFMAVQDADVENGDIVVPVSGGIAGLTLGEITGVYKIADFDGVTHHLEADVRRI